MILGRYLLAILVISLVPICSSASLGSSRDVTMFAPLFQWFEQAMEMIFGYFWGPRPSNEGKRQKVTKYKPKINYDNYQLIRLNPDTEEAVNELRNLEDEPALDFWSPPLKNRSADLLAPPDMADYLKEYLQERNIQFEVLIPNLQAEIKKQNPIIENRSNQLKIGKDHSLTWDRYHRYKDIEAYLDYLGKSSGGLAKVIKIGKSSEGRALKVVKISSNRNKTNPAIWIDGGMHGREWIAPATALYVLRQLVENYKTNKAFVDGIDWYIMPVANPDGYEFSHSSDRFWRKNRARAPKEASDDYDSEYSEARTFFWDDGKACDGVDLNRNFDFHWGEVGTSKDPCKATYGGKYAFSEPESRAISDFIMKESELIKSYVTLHAYSQMILVPWGFTKQTATDHSDLMYVGRKALEALKKVYGTNYKIGTSPNLLYPTSGSSDDWAKGKAGIKYSYTIELRDKGTHGFLLPASQILPTGRETFAALKTIAKHVTLEH